MTGTFLENALNEKITQGAKLFIPYIMAGDGGLENLEERIQLLADAGASAIELGIPFSDPVADGPTIQAAGQRALAASTTLKDVFATLQQFKTKSPVPLVFMTYINPIFKYGVDAFFAACAQAGVSGIIIPDLPIEEEGLVQAPCQKHDIALIRLAAMTSTADRIATITKRAEGFLYAVSVTGTTGARAKHSENTGAYLENLKRISPVPVLAGFGVSTAAQAQQLGSHCDGVIVGSKIVQLFHDGDTEAIRSLIQASTQIKTTRA